MRTCSIVANGSLAVERAQIRDQERQPQALLESNARGPPPRRTGPGGSAASRQPGRGEQRAPTRAAQRRRSTSARAPARTDSRRRRPAASRRTVSPVAARGVRGPSGRRRGARRPDPPPVRAARSSGPLEETIGRSSTSCSREQIGQFWIRRLCRQKLGSGIAYVQFAGRLPSIAARRSRQPPAGPRDSPRRCSGRGRSPRGSS